ncbi:MAG: PEP-CTERM sorting domain-containing protein [Phycisphaerae bacterium]|nr:PEP-CTERM sorting domain-containing protein [Phycisphaerae bacterium]
MKWVVGSLMMVLAVAAVSAGAAVVPVESTFAAGLDGWTGINNVKLDWVSTGGPSGDDGYLRFTDLGDGWGTIVAPDKFVGNLLDYNGGILAFDFKVFTYGEGVMEHLPIVLTLVTSSGSYKYTVASAADVAALGTTEWEHFEVPMTASAWGITGGELVWQMILRNVKGVQITVEAAFNSTAPYDVTGIAGIALTPKDYVKAEVPEPATLTLLAAGGALALWRRRGRRA